MSAAKFQYTRLMQFYETDGMGIIHHANYLRLFEEARLEFLRQVAAKDAGENILEGVNYPLVHCEVQYKKPLRFNDEVTVEYGVTTEGARLIFEYALQTKSFQNPVAFGKTVHVAFDMKLQRARRLPVEVVDFLAQARK